MWGDNFVEGRGVKLTGVNPCAPPPRLPLYQIMNTHLPIQQIQCNESARVLESGRSHHAQSQRTTPTNYHHLGQLDVSQLHSVHRASQRLYEGCLPRWNTLRNLKTQISHQVTITLSLSLTYTHTHTHTHTHTCSTV